jgi:alpha-tubulin suppressor-like RCC1 family protein
MAELRQNTWSLNAWYEQDYAGNVDYTTTVNAGFVWGKNQNGQLGQNNRTTYSSPIQIPGNWSTLEGGNNATHGVKSDGTLWAWGRNDQGRLGVNQPTSSKYSSPVQIPGTTWSTNRNHLDNRSGVLGAAIKTDGTLWTWGYGTYGRLGQNSNSSYSSPRQVPGTAWNVLSTSYNGQFCIRTDGTLWAWGNNDNGSNAGILGQNNRTSYSSPRQIPGTTWSYVVASSSGGNVVATKTDGTMWTWGSNSYGALAQGGISHNIKYSSPVQIPGSWTDEFGIGNYSPLCVKSDGTLWSWGYNSQGQLGQNNKTMYSSPVQIPGTTWSKVGARANTVFGIKTDGTAWAWGQNNYGMLGANFDDSDRSSPIQIPGTDWNRFNVGSDHVCGTKIV